MRKSIKTVGYPIGTRLRLRGNGRATGAVALKRPALPVRYNPTKVKNTKQEKKMPKKSNETALVSSVNPSAIVPSGLDAFDAFAQEGFIEDATIKVGDPNKEGNVGLYAGELIGPGADIELSDGQGTMPTWMFHPLVRAENGAIVPSRNVIHSVISSAQLDAGCKRAAALSAARGCKIWVAAAFSHRGENRNGQPLNHFRIAIREVA